MAPFRLRALPAALVLAATACTQAGPSPAPPAAPSSAAAGLSAPEPASLAGRNAAARGTVTARIDGLVTGRRVTGTVSVKLDGSRCTHDLETDDGGRMVLIQIADRYWTKGMTGRTPPGDLRLAEAYVRFTADDYPAAGFFCRTVIRHATLTRAFQDPGQLRRDGGGEGRIRLTDRHGALVELSDTAAPVPLLVRSGSNSEYYELTFSTYGFPVEPVEPPPAWTVDFADLGLGGESTA
ncbi:hypothetical protein ACIA8O_13965 [Kitasatospora sp. NPDC051853]|uniref:hypothetical protein n=1 Tax=Kitasatospora sp. NPDC051853 TaxID=3364058 RepID=UPI00378D4DFD